MKRRKLSPGTGGCVAGMLLTLWATAGSAGAAGLPGKWVEVRTPHFVVVSNAGERSARLTAEHFEHIRGIFTQALPALVAESGPPLRVFAADGDRTMKQLYPEAYARKRRARPAGTFRSIPTGSQAAVRADLLGSGDYGTVYHEYFHFLARGTRVPMPVWINEGLASYWGNTRLTAKVAEVGRPDGARLRWLREGYFLSLEELMTVDRSSPHYRRSGKAQQFYAQSWALTHYLMLGDKTGKGRQQLIDYLRRIDHGESSREAALKAFGDLRELRSSLRAYTRRSVFPYVKMPLPNPLPEELFEVREIPRAEASALVALFRLEARRAGHGVEELVAAALEGASDLVESQVAAGLLHAWRSEYDQAEQAFARAMGLEGTSALAHYGFAVLRHTLDPTPEGLATAEQHLAQALALEPKLAPARVRLAEIWRRNSGCSHRALAYVRGARILEPQYFPYGLKEAQILLECGESEAARAAVRRLVDEAAASESSSRNNSVCWDGSLWGLAREVLPACDRAIALAPEDFASLDSRGVARAILGDLEGAAADLRAALKLVGADGWDEQTAATREAWVDSLESGQNPFAGDGLAEFRDDPAEVGLRWWM